MQDMRAPFIKTDVKLNVFTAYPGITYCKDNDCGNDIKTDSDKLPNLIYSLVLCIVPLTEDTQVN